MKKMMMVLMSMMLVSLSTLSPAADHSITKSLTASWNQTAEDYPRIASWSLYWSNSPDTGYVRADDINHPDDNPLTQKSITLTITGTPGTTIRRYFQLTAWGRVDGKETARSNTVFYDFIIPTIPIGAPSNFTITI